MNEDENILDCVMGQTVAGPLREEMHGCGDNEHGRQGGYRSAREKGGV